MYHVSTLHFIIYIYMFTLQDTKKDVPQDAPTKSASAEELTPPEEVEADEYSSSDNEEIDASHINDPIVQAYAKVKPNKKKKASPEPEPSEGDEPYDPYCPTSTETSSQLEVPVEVSRWFGGSQEYTVPLYIRGTEYPFYCPTGQLFLT